MGNLGAAGGMVEVICSLMALKHREMFPILNYESPDPECAINAAPAGSSPGPSFINLNTSPQGQASAVLIREFTREPPRTSRCRFEIPITGQLAVGRGG